MQINVDELEALILSENRKAFAFQRPIEEMVATTAVPAHLGKEVTLHSDNAVKPFDEEFICSICLCFVAQACVSSACCDKLFCKACVRGLKSCPCCTGAKFKCLPKVNRILRNYLLQTRFTCDFCEQIFTYE